MLGNITGMYSAESAVLNLGILMPQIALLIIFTREDYNLESPRVAPWQGLFTCLHH